MECPFYPLVVIIQYVPGYIFSDSVDDDDWRMMDGHCNGVMLFVAEGGSGHNTTLIDVSSKVLSLN